MLLLDDIKQLLTLPEISIDLMYEEDSSPPFYRDLAKEFYAEATARHPKLPLIKRLTHGVALCQLPETYDDYFMMVEGSARRNYRKAKRQGYTFRLIEFNDHLEDIKAIRQSTEVRQGKMPKEFLEGEVAPCQNPPNPSTVHAYPYFGVFKDDTLVAYLGCLICGELCMIEHIYGHADYQSDGVTPYLIMNVPAYVMEQHPHVRVYAYGTFFGAQDSMRRFKKKLTFMPHRVTWILSAKP